MPKTTCGDPQCGKDHSLHLREGSVELILVGGPHPYLWFGRDDKCILHFGNRRLMRQLAKALAKELGLTLAEKGADRG